MEHQKFDDINIISNENAALLNIKNSKFHSYIYNVNKKDDVDNILSNLKKEHYKASHICYAYRIGKSNITEFSTDAGEPSGTAGKPILGVLLKYNITDALLVVIRYFGGTKLGIRGLIDAYKNSSDEVIKNITLKKVRKYKIIEINIDYTNLDKLKHKMRNNNGIILDIQYINSVTLKVAFDFNEYFQFHKPLLNELLGSNFINNYTEANSDWLEVKN